MLERQVVEAPSAKGTNPTERKPAWISYIVPESSPITLVVASSLIVLLWIGTRLWWPFAPEFVLPIIMGAYAVCLVRRSDLPLISVIAGFIATFWFPLMVGEKPTVSPGILIDFPRLIEARPVMALQLSAIILASASITSRYVRSHLTDKFSKVLLALLLLGFVYAGAIAQSSASSGGVLHQVVDTVPQAENYGWDGYIYLKTFYLMEDGLDYYHAFAKATTEDSRMVSAPDTLFGWRVPGAFYLWKLLFDSGGGMALGFLLLAAVEAYLAFLIARHLSSGPLALPVAALVLGYLFTGAVTMWMPFMEYWGLAFVLTAALLFLHERPVLSASIALFAPIVRELYVFTIAAGFLGELVRKRLRYLLPWLISGMGFGLLYAIHYSLAKAVVPNLSLRAHWISVGNWLAPNISLTAFTSYIFANPNQAILFWLAGLIGLFAIKSIRARVFLLVIALAVPIAMIQSGYDCAYWGLAFVPIAYLGFAPLALSILDLERKQAQAASHLSRKTTWITYTVPESSPITLVVASSLIVLLWIGTRLWWPFAPEFVLPIIMGAYAVCLVRRSDLPLISVIAGITSFMLFPLSNGNHERIWPGVAIAFPQLIEVKALAVLTAVILIYLSSLVFSRFLSLPRRRLLIYGCLAIVLAGLVSGAVLDQSKLQEGSTFREVIDQEPQAEKYGWDGQLYFKTFYLMESGLGFYKAFPTAIIEDSRSSTPPPSVLGWRLPTLFYIWKILFNSGDGMATGFLFVLCITAFLGFLVARELSTDAIALPAASLVGAYMYTGAVSVWLPFSEFWVLPVILVAGYFVLRQRTVLAASVALFAASIRELVVFTIAAGFTADLFGRRLRELWPWISAGGLFVLIYLAHYSAVKSMIPDIRTDAHWAFTGGWGLVNGSIAYFTTYLFANINQATVFWAMGIIGFLSIRSLRNKAFFIIASLALPTLMWFFGHENAWYWGITYTPIAYLGYAPLAMFLTDFVDGPLLTRLKTRASIFATTSKHKTSLDLELSPGDIVREEAERKYLNLGGVALIALGAMAVSAELLSFIVASLPVHGWVLQLGAALIVIGGLLLVMAKNARTD